MSRALPLLLAVLLAGCGESDASDDAAVRVVATTGQAADFARAVGGDRVAVTGLLAPNTDPHDFEVRPDDVKALADADLIVRSGAGIDDWLDDAIASSGGDAPAVDLSRSVAVVDDDPHWWQDPYGAMAAVRALRDALVDADGAGAGAYRANAAAYEAELKRLDRGVRACLDKVPAAQRTLVTTHDSLAYFARRYDIRVIGAVIPSQSTVAQPSAGDVAALVDTIRREGVRAVFAESSVNADVEEAIARDAGAVVGRALWADTLGPEGSDGATYVDSIASNTAALVDGFSGGEVACRP
jgi:ABC-type Zn uptake system ZnuABC Zn-binding protein ZnuA